METELAMPLNSAALAAKNGAPAPASTPESWREACGSAKQVRATAFEGAHELLGDDHKVMRAYRSALSAFNSGNWDAAVSLSAKTLENIALSELGFNERSGNLAQLMEKMVHQLNTDQPFVELSSALKPGGGLVEHFNLEKSSDASIAALTIDLIECFISYNYVFRARLRQLIAMVQPGADEVIEVAGANGFGHGNGHGNGNGSNGNGHGNGNGKGSAHARATSLRPSLFNE